MPEQVHGILDTSVLNDLNDIPRNLLPDRFAITTLSLAELGVGVLSCSHPGERANRLATLQYFESTFMVVPFDNDAARAYGRIYVAVTSAGRKPRGGRAVDFMIAATALSRQLPFYTRNATDFAGFEELLPVFVV